MKQVTAALLQRLGYSGSRGFVPSERFGTMRANRHVLLQAQERVGVIGVFGIFGKREDTHEYFTPIVYIAECESAKAREHHKAVWNQGVVPYLLLITDEEILLCEGFRFSNREIGNNNWPGLLERTSHNSLYLQSGLPSYLKWLSAYELQSSIFWRDRQVGNIDISGRVDYQLLNGLDALTDCLTKAEGVLADRNLRPLDVESAHALIGRVLYLYFLHDKGLLSNNWRADAFPGINFDQASGWDAEQFWQLSDEIDSVFNGSVFPLSASKRKRIEKGHIEFAQIGLRYADSLGTAGFQNRLDLFDYDFSTLRIETLSSVYEQFLRGYGEDAQRKLGAYYTPPFLVDYVLSTVEENVPLERGVRILDGAAGSGAFLVAAYRRIIESTLGASRHSLPIRDLQSILKESIFGYELSADACHVTCFNLYLTLLDYVEEADLRQLLSQKGRKKVFPALLDTNVVNADFFDRRNENRSKFDVVVGNPPWKAIDANQDKVADRYLKIHFAEQPIGERQLAELFVWRYLTTFLSKNGVAGLLMPSKSFYNPASRAFRTALARASTLIGVADFSNLRHVMFERAVHPTMALFFRKKDPATDDSVWHFSPIRAEQPGAVARSNDKTRMWTLFIDEAAVQVTPYSAIEREPDIWSRLAWQKPIDRLLMNYFCDLAAHRYSNLETCARKLDISIARGGNSSDTGVPDKYILTARPSDDTYFLHHLKLKSVTRSLFPASSSSIVPLPQIISRRARGTYKQKFQGPLILLPRSLADVYYVDADIAYNSSFIGLSTKTSSSHEFLEALSKYLSSKVAKYFLILRSTRFLVDRPNIEPMILGQLPIPFAEDGVLQQQLIAADRSQVDQIVFDALKLTPEYRLAVDEFLKLRSQFADGRIPDEATRQVTSAELHEYSKFLSSDLDRWLGREASYTIRIIEARNRGVCLVKAAYRDAGGGRRNDIAADADLEAWLDQHIRNGLSSLSNSSAVIRDQSSASIYLVKPLEFMHWTVERAFADSQKMVRAVMAGAAA
ncbi:MAG TPA: N-6 DNA methylase [Gammaproteobacteria bacterium]